MKQRLQFVAVLAIGLLTLQPVFAGLPSAFGMPVSCGSGCPMAMNGMGPDCPMMGRTTAIDCPGDCCTHSLPQAMLFLASPARLKLMMPAQFTLLPAVIFARQQGLRPQAPMEARIVSPPRYILNQVFRI